MRFRGPTVALSTFLLFGAVTAVCAQSLADVAKKEEDRRKGIKEPAKVYTNGDLKGVPPATATPPPAEPTKAANASAAKSKDTKDDKAADPKKDRAYWSGRQKELQAGLERDQTYADALQTRINSLNTDFINRADPVQRAAIAQNKQKAIDELTRLKQSIQSRKKAIDDLSEEARKAGVPPGWLR